MRVGILTLHAQTNYGAVLQAYALRNAISEMGHDVRVIDRWRDDDCARLKGILASRSPRLWMNWLKAAVSCTGVVAELRRRLATMRFIRGNLNLTDYHFRYWKDAPRDMGLDVIVVGSDQVWNAANLVPADYLLKETPPNLPGIAYAASIGMTAIPDDLRSEYCEGFRRFKAISVREKTAAKMVEECGSHADVVVDPTLLVPRSFWDRFRPAPPRKPYVVCCFLLEDIDAMKQTLKKFTAESGVDVEMFVGGYWRWPTLNPDKIRKNLKDFRRWREAGVRLRLSAGPAEFASSIAGSSGVVTNSYHALMFSLIYGKNVRVMQPTDPSRRVMSARFDEIAESFVRGPLFAKSLEEGLSGALSGDVAGVDAEALEARVDFSRRWLKNALESAVEQRK